MTSLMLSIIIKVCLSSLMDYSFSLYKGEYSQLYDIFSAEAVNITLVDNFESGLAETDVFNRFER